MTKRATTSLSVQYHVKPGQKDEALVEMKGMLDRCAKEPEFIMAIIHETPERPPYRKAYIESVRLTKGRNR